MDYNNHNTEKRTNKHLSLQERFYIEARLRLGDSISAIAAALGYSRTTIYAEIKRGFCTQIKRNKHIEMYLADRGQTSYKTSRKVLLIP